MTRPARLRAFPEPTVTARDKRLGFIGACVPAYECERWMATSPDWETQQNMENFSFVLQSTCMAEIS